MRWQTPHKPAEMLPSPMNYPDQMAEKTSGRAAEYPGTGADTINFVTTSLTIFS
jgi:hypothetical protein